MASDSDWQILSVLAQYRADPTTEHNLMSVQLLMHDFETGPWLTIPIPRDNKACLCCSYKAIKNEADFVLECPLYNSISDRFPSLFQNVILGNLKSFFQLNQQVDLSYYLKGGHCTLILKGISLFDTILMHS